MMSSFGIPCSGAPLSTLVAIDLNSGEKRWEVPLGTLEDFFPVVGRFVKGSPSFGGPAVTASGLTFIASTAFDYYLRAFSTETGEELWKGRLPTSGMATPMTYRTSAKAKQYVVISAGGHFVFPGAGGAYVVAFALPD